MRDEDSDHHCANEDQEVGPADCPRVNPDLGLNQFNGFLDLSDPEDCATEQDGNDDQGRDEQGPIDLWRLSQRTLDRDLSAVENFSAIDISCLDLALEGASVPWAVA